MPKFKPYLHLFIAAFLAAVVPSSADGRVVGVRGDIGLGYTDYEVSKGGAAAGEADSFYQKYRVSTWLVCSIYNGKNRPYRLFVDFNYIDYVTHINSKKYSPSQWFINWDGDLKLYLPSLKDLRLLMFSERTKTPFHRTERVASGTILGTGFLTGLGKNSYNYTGIYGSFGERGGPRYHFSYLIDEAIRTEGGRSKYTRANFSVNSGVNWLHLSRTLYTDSRGGIRRRTFSVNVGNIALPQYRGKTRWRGTWFSKRLWYRLTNWLEISTDLLYTKERTTAASTPQTETDTNTFNFLVRGEREWWRLGTFSTYSRSQNSDWDRYYVSLPLWFDIFPDPSTRIFLVSRYSESVTENSVTKKSKTLGESIDIYTWPRHWLRVEGKYTYDRKANKVAGAADNTDITSHTVTFWGYTERKKKLDFIFSYSFNTAVSNEAIDEGTLSSTHSLSGTVKYTVSPDLYLDLNQGYQRAFSRGRVPAEKYDKYTTGLTAVGRAAHNVGYNIFVGRDTVSNDDGSRERANHVQGNLNVTVFGKLKYNSRLWLTDLKSDVVSDRQTRRWENDIVYKATARIESRSEVDFTRELENDIDRRTTVIGERLIYSHFKSGIGKRKIYDVEGGYHYNKTDYGTRVARFSIYSLYVNYYPTTAISCGASLSIKDSNSKTQEEKIRGAYVAFRYPLLDFVTRYERRETGGGWTKEDKFSFDLTKRF